MADGEVDNSWVELETALGLLENLDTNEDDEKSHQTNIPEELRADIWQAYLGVDKNVVSSFDEIYDLPQQAILRDDCQQLVDKLGNEEEDKVSVISDLESVLTSFCKSHQLQYHRNNGWLEVLAPLVALKLTRSQLLECFTIIANKFIIRNCSKIGQCFHFLRLLLQYHDPELCSFLDNKRIAMDSFSSTWFRSLLAGVCDLKVIQNMWDVYFQHGDPFFIFFLSLVILVNAKEQLMRDTTESRESLIEQLTMAPTALEADDIEDFCSLAKFYADRTPQLFRKEYQHILFGLLSEDSGQKKLISQALCIPVSIHELISHSSFDPDTVENVRYFVVDCRPADQYNSGHLPTAFHLDSTLMLQDPKEFAAAVEALFVAQRQALAVESVAGGEHLCFMGSGREKEDQFVNMVVASFLQKHTQYVGLARGGYLVLHELLQDKLSKGLSDHSIGGCIVCNPDAGSQTSDTADSDDFSQKGTLLGRLSSAMKSKTAEMTGKLVDYIQNPNGGQFVERHVSSKDKTGKMYRNMAPVFSIDDDHNGDDVGHPAAHEEMQDIVNLSAWLQKPNLLGNFKCHQVNENGYMFASYLIVTATNIYILREISEKPGFAYVISRRSLSNIVKITSKRKHPELITFKYGVPQDDSFLITDLDRFLIPNAREASSLVKTQVLKTLENS